MREIKSKRLGVYRNRLKDKILRLELEKCALSHYCEELKELLKHKSLYDALRAPSAVKNAPILIDGAEMEEMRGEEHDKGKK